MKFNFVIIVLTSLILVTSAHQDHTTRLASSPGPKIVDLSHELNKNTLHWPTVAGFEINSTANGTQNSGVRNETFYLLSDEFKMAVHCGTHLDAPRHFSTKGWTVEQIPLERLINVPVTVIDVSHAVANNKSYNFAKSDFIDAKTGKSLVEPRSVVLVYTGVSQQYDNGVEAYIGTKDKNISQMKIPGFSAEAATYLVDMQVYGVGLDAPSADSSERHHADSSIDPQAHIIFNSNNVYILENVSKRLEELKNSTEHYHLTIAPLPITGGSGSPVRLIATATTAEHCRQTPSNSASSLNVSLASILLVAIISLTS